MPRIITEKSNKKLRREYRARFATALFTTLSFALFFVAVFFIPAYGLLHYYENSYSGMNSLDRKENTRLANEEYDKKLQETHELSQKILVSKSDHLEIADILFAYAQDALVFDSLEFERVPGATTISLRGLAPTRESLLSFERKIDSDKNFEGFEIPIDSLRMQTDIPFNISFTHYES